MVLHENKQRKQGEPIIEPNPAPEPAPKVETKPLTEAEMLMATLSGKNSASLTAVERFAIIDRLRVLTMTEIQSEAKAVMEDFTKVFTQALIGTRYQVDNLLVGNKAGAVKLGPVGATKDGKQIYVVIQTS